jgi:2-dehydro-3-deoxyphosphogluconate aldolase / (4S)-4-hydroxy-2-oxoglutarate aldolase
MAEQDIEPSEVYRGIARHRVIPVIAIDEAQHALPLADALIEGGLPVAEITFRTRAAASVLRQLRDERPQLMLGAGTVLDRESMHLALDCGARFALAPGFNPAVAAAALEIGLPFLPGVATPSELEQAMSLGFKVLKFFPAGDAGGARMLRSLSAPYGHTGVRFIPTGGVTPDNLAEYLSVPTVIAVGGTWIASRETIKAEKWETIRDNCRKVVELVQGGH